MKKSMRRQLFARFDQPYRFLVRASNWIGDAVMSAAALREMQRLYPKAHITLLANEWVAGLYRGQDLGDEVVAFKARSPFQKLPGEAYDAAFLFPNSFRSALDIFLSRVPVRVGYRRDGRGLLLTHSARPRTKSLGKHQVYSYLDLLFQSGASPIDYVHRGDFSPDISLQATARGRLEAERLLNRYGPFHNRLLVALNPGAYYGAAKRWLSERYAELADRLIHELDSPVVIVGSHQERRLAEEIRSLMSEEPVLLSGQTSLPGLAGLLAEVSLLVTNDSGPMHLAAALGVPQIAIFGSTDDAATGPFHPKARVIHKRVECSPCLLRECPIDLRCFKRIEVEEVFETARQMLAVPGECPDGTCDRDL